VWRYHGRKKYIARGRFTANYSTLKLVFWQTKVMVLKDSVLTISENKKNSKLSIFRCQKSPFFWADFFIRRFFVHTPAAAEKFFKTSKRLFHNILVKIPCNFALFRGCSRGKFFSSKWKNHFFKMYLIFCT
jgi:hypothetical protein